MTRAAGGPAVPVAWSRAAEEVSLRSRDGHPGFGAAAARFDGLADAAARMALVREIVSARAAELTLAYRNLVAVAAGYRARRDRRGREYLMPEPCVVFIVKRKWSGKTAAKPGPASQALPARLLTWGPAPGDPAQRVLYAVPTDVQTAARFAGARAQSASCVRMGDAQFPLPGTLACGVLVEGAATPPLGLSAMHVLNPLPRRAEPMAGLQFADGFHPVQALGVSTAWGGRLDPASRGAFDAQLARIDATGWFDAAFSGWQLSSVMPYVAAPDIFDALAPTRQFRLLVADNHPAFGRSRPPLLAQFSAHVGPAFTITYEFRAPGGLARVALRHAQLLLLTISAACAPPVRGDSGSAVLCTGPDGQPTLVGMYIARGSTTAAGARQAYVLPAWQLFDPAQWSVLPPGAVSLRPTFQIRASAAGPT